MIGRAVQDRAAERAIASRVSAAREPRAAAVPAAADVAADEAWAGAPPRPGPRKALVTTAIAQAASSVACAPRRIIGHGALLHALNRLLACPLGRPHPIARASNSAPLRFMRLPSAWIAGESSSTPIQRGCQAVGGPPRGRYPSAPVEGAGSGRTDAAPPKADQ